MATPERAPRYPGPSPAARERLNRLLLCLLDNGPLTIREAIGQLSEPMGRSDADSACRRLRGSGACEWATRHSDGRTVMKLTVHGERLAQQLVEQGEGY